MPVERHTLISLVFLSCVLACGPEQPTPSPTWLSGAFSDIGVQEVARSSVARVDFIDDGAARFWSFAVGAGACGGSTSNVLEYVWEYDGVDSAIIWDHGVGSPVYSLVTPTQECDVVEVHYMDNGVEIGSYKLHRGAMCLVETGAGCPSGVECDPCKTAWCDGPPSCG
jgi:hypothetical protein